MEEGTKILSITGKEGLGLLVTLAKLCETANRLGEVAITLCEVRAEEHRQNFYPPEQQAAFLELRGLRLDAERSNEKERLARSQANIAQYQANIMEAQRRRDSAKSTSVTATTTAVPTAPKRQHHPQQGKRQHPQQSNPAPLKAPMKGMEQLLKVKAEEEEVPASGASSVEVTQPEAQS